jgi:hypothetical protein
VSRTAGYLCTNCGSCSLCVSFTCAEGHNLSCWSRPVHGFVLFSLRLAWKHIEWGLDCLLLEETINLVVRLVSYKAAGTMNWDIQHLTHRIPAQMHLFFL